MTKYQPAVAVLERRPRSSAVTRAVAEQRSQWRKTLDNLEKLDWYEAERAVWLVEVITQTVSLCRAFICETPATAVREDILVELHAARQSLREYIENEPAIEICDSLKRVLRYVEESIGTLESEQTKAGHADDKTMNIATVQGTVGHLIREARGPLVIILDNDRWATEVAEINQWLKDGHALIGPNGVAVRTDKSSGDLTEEQLMAIDATLSDMTDGNLLLVPQFSSMP